LLWKIGLLQVRLYHQMRRKDMNKLGYRDLAVSLSLESLRLKSMLSIVEEVDWEGDPYTAFMITDKGIQWILDNQDKFVLQDDLEVSVENTQTPASDIPF
jgi:hypothetical protein